MLPHPTSLALTLLVATACSPAIDGPLHRFDHSEGDALDVVIVTLDTTRADHIGAYGYPRPTTPVLDALAADSLLFERFHVPVATTLPVHTSLFTGLEPTEHGIVANMAFSGERFVAPAGVETLAGWLGSRGYDCAAFVSATPVKHQTGIAEGFATYKQPRTFERTGAETVDLAIGWLGEQALPPYLLWVHLYDPHHPWEPALLDRVRWRPDETLRAWAHERGLGEDDLDTLARYDAELRETDAQLGRLVDSLKAAGRWDRTVLVIAGDHGEGLGQHGITHHGMVWGEQLHAPLLIRAPGLEPGRSDALATATDLVPTLLGLLELEDGASLGTQATGLDLLGEQSSRQGLLARTSPKREAEGGGGHRTIPETWAWTTDEWVLHWTVNKAVALYHRPTDPHEQQDVLADERPRSAKLYRQARQAHTQQLKLGRSLGAGELAPLDEGLIRELEVLGYMD